MIRSLSEAARKLVEKEIDDIFDRLIISFLGPTAPTKSKSIIFSASYNQTLSLPGIYFGSMEASGKPARSLDTLKSAVRVASNYMESLRSDSKAKILHTIETELANHQKGISEDDFRESVQNSLEDVMLNITRDLKTIVAAESTKAKNIAAMEAISQIGRDIEVDDPTVFFAVIKDKRMCKECKRLHLQEDLIIPRVWKLSEIKHDYHKRGESNPSVHGLHPHCRCFLTILPPGYSFNEDGRLRYVSFDYDEHSSQRKAS